MWWQRWVLSRLACLLLALQLGSALADCPLEPPAGVTNALRSPGDGGYHLQVTGDPERYVPGSVYTLSLMAPPGKSFRRFLVTVEPADGELRWAGSFQLFADSAAQFAPSCINAISEDDAGNAESQVEVNVMWRAPQSGSGCVLFRAMAMDDTQSWYADEGQLRRTLCELVVPRQAEPGEDEPRECCACSEAKYSLVFKGIWSNVTHPKDFPFSLWLTHFSDVIGASHEANFSFWGEGQIASDGFRQLAEWGSAGWLERELRTKSRHLRTLFKAPGLWYPRVNEQTNASFNVDKRRHLVSLSSMFGPSPDWVVGVNGLDLCLPDCSWIERKVIDLYPIDAGTDSGITYMSPNAPTIPREKMYRITTMYPEDPRSPFYDTTGAAMQPLARLTLERETVVRKSCQEEDYDDSDQEEESPFEDTDNNNDSEKPECRVDEWQPWSPCSVSCGKGLRMRQRTYQMAAKAEMLGCDRQLVQKEMCVAHEASCPGDPVELDPNEVAQFNEDSVCAVTTWGPWSSCSSSCGPGTEVRTRRFHDRMGIKKCPFVEVTEHRNCTGPPCTLTEVLDPRCRVTSWSDWSPCSVSCGQGRKVRTRLLLLSEGPLKEHCARYSNLREQRPCSIKETCIVSALEAEDACLEPEQTGPCRAYFERWYFDKDARECRPFGFSGCRGNRNNFHSLTECNTVCAGVRDKLTRGYSFPPRPPQLQDSPASLVSGGSAGSPVASAVSPDGPRVDCVMSEWTDWSACSASCGLGQRERSRRVLVEPLRGGLSCGKRLVKRKKCFAGPCDPFQTQQEFKENDSR